MKKWSLLTFAILAGPAMAQGRLSEATPEATFLSAPVGPSDSPATLSFADPGPAESSDALRSNRNFPNFIGFISNPLQSIDPRSLTQVVPLFGATSVSTTPALPKADFQVVGPAISVALTDRFSVGLNQGGYAFAQFDRNDRTPVSPTAASPLSPPASENESGNAAKCSAGTVADSSTSAASPSTP